MTTDGNGCFYLLDINNSFLESTGGMAFCCLLIIIFLVMCFFFSMCREAVNKASASVLKSIVKNETSSLRRALKIKEKSDKYIRRTHAGTAANSAALTGCSFLFFTEPLQRVLLTIIHDDIAALIVSSIIILILDTVAVAAFGYFIPVRYVNKHAEQILLRMNGLLIAFSVLFVPVSAVANALTFLIMKLSGAEKTGSKKTDNPTEEKTLITVSAEDFSFSIK